MNDMLETRDEFFRNRYGTLLFALIVIAVSAAAYFYFYRHMFAPSALQRQLAAVWGVATACAAVVSYDFQGGRVYGGNLFGIPDRWKEKLLPVAVVAVLTLLGLLCSLTGGSTTSPFSHYLTAVGGLAIVFARQLRSRLFIGGAAVLAFYASGQYYFPLCGDRGVCSDATIAVQSFLLFHTACLIVVTAMALKAVTQTPPRLPS